MTPAGFGRGPGRGLGAAALASLILALVLVFAAGAGWAAPKFPPLTGRVVDDANLLSPEAEAQLTNELAALEQKTGHQVVVATLPDLQGYEIEDYGYQLLRTWGIGRKTEDDGLILIVAPSQRKVRIEVGYGLEPIMTDAMSSLIIQQRILPAFKAGDFEKGVLDGTQAIVRQLGLPEAEARAAVAEASARTAQPAPAADQGTSIPVLFIVFIVFVVLSQILGRRRGGGLWWLLPLLFSGGGGRRGGDGWSGGGGGFGGGGFGGGGFSGGGGSGGGGGASGSW